MPHGACEFAVGQLSLGAKHPEVLAGDDAGGESAHFLANRLGGGAGEVPAGDSGECGDVLPGQPWQQGESFGDACGLRMAAFVLRLLSG